MGPFLSRVYTSQSEASNGENGRVQGHMTSEDDRYVKILASQYLGTVRNDKMTPIHDFICILFTVQVYGRKILRT